MQEPSDVTKYAQKKCILVCGDFINPSQPLSTQCADALEDIGWDVYRANTQDYRIKPLEVAKRWSKSLAKLVGLKQKLSDFYKRREIKVRNNPVRNIFLSRKFDAVLVIRGNGLDPALLRTMRDKGAIIVGWWLKDVRRAEQMLEERSLYNLYFCIHPDLGEHCNIAHLPAFAVDPKRYFPPEQQHKIYDVAFVGVWTPKRQMYLEQITDNASIATVGPGWFSRTFISNRLLSKAVVAYHMQGEKLVKFYQSAKIVVNINQWEADEASGTTLRVADVPACGTFFLTEYSTSLKDHFEIGREIVSFASPSEFREKVLYYLQHDKEREAIAYAGHKKSLRLPTHVDRMRVITDATLEYILNNAGTSR